MAVPGPLLDLGWRALRQARWLLVAAGWAVVVLLWFGIPALTSRSPFVAASNALGSGRRLTNDKVFGTIGRFTGLNVLAVQLAALVAVAIALRGAPPERSGWPWVPCCGCSSRSRSRCTAGRGWRDTCSRPPRVVVVLAGVAVGWLLEVGSCGRRAPAWARWAGPALVVVLLVALLPSALSHARTEHKDLREQRLRTAEINRLQPAINAARRRRAAAGCGEPLTRLEYQTMLAYTLEVNVAKVGFKYGQAIGHGNPIVLFTPTPSGWLGIQAMHQTSPACRSLPQAS